MTEKDHKPSEILPVDGRIYTKEWLEQVIHRIHRKIDNVRIFPIRIDGDLSRSIYVVKIPESNECPHMADNHKYYKRFNFSSVPMEEFEVRNSFNKKLSPTLLIDSCAFCKNEQQLDEKNITYSFLATIVNKSNNIGERYKLNAVFIEDIEHCSLSHRPLERNNSYTIIERGKFKVSMSSQECIYPYEILSLGDFTVKVKREYENTFWDNVIIELTLFYQGGSETVLYIPKTQEFVDDNEEIQKIREERRIQLEDRFRMEDKT